MIKKFCTELDPYAGLQGPGELPELRMFFDTLDSFYEDKLNNQSYDDMLSEAIQEAYDDTKCNVAEFPVS